MIPEVTQENVHILIPYKVSKICSQIASERQIPLTRAIADFYKSNTARLLEDEGSKLWQEGWVGLYDLYMEEKGDGYDK